MKQIDKHQRHGVTTSYVERLIMIHIDKESWLIVTRKIALHFPKWNLKNHKKTWKAKTTTAVGWPARGSPKNGRSFGHLHHPFFFSFLSTAALTTRYWRPHSPILTRHVKTGLSRKNEAALDNIVFEYKWSRFSFSLHVYMTNLLSHYDDI